MAAAGQGCQASGRAPGSEARGNWKRRSEATLSVSCCKRVGKSRSALEVLWPRRVADFPQSSYDFRPDLPSSASLQRFGVTVTSWRKPEIGVRISAIRVNEDGFGSDFGRRALERVMASRTFSRSDQLRSFLRYICDAELEGRAHELNEYVLGVSVLGRPASYSPTEDSCVRSRAHELRNKLKSYYRLEAPDDPIQIARSNISRPKSLRKTRIMVVHTSPTVRQTGFRLFRRRPDFESSWGGTCNRRDLRARRSKPT